MHIGVIDIALGIDGNIVDPNNVDPTLAAEVINSDDPESRISYHFVYVPDASDMSNYRSAVVDQDWAARFFDPETQRMAKYN